MKSYLGPILWATLFLWASSALSADSLRHVRIEDANSQELALQLQRQGFDVLEGSITGDNFELIVSTGSYQSLVDAGYALKTLAEGRPFKEIQAERQTQLNVPTGYPELDEILTQLADLESTFPDICQFVDLTETYNTPATVEGRHLYALKISDNVLVDEDEPAFLMVSNHHAREIVTPVLALYAIEQLTMNYGLDPLITSLVNSHEIWIAPVWNPDGYSYVFNTDNMWRKNRRVFLNGIGVDQNRNYPHGWDSPCSGNNDPSSDIFKGPSPASEAETQTMIAWSMDRQFAKVLDYHSYGSEVLHGYACWDHPFDDYLEEKAIALSYAAGYDGDHRPPTADGEHYQWQLGKMGALAFLMETQSQFQPAYAVALSEAALVWPGTRWLLQQPIPLDGYVTNASNGDPVEATITCASVGFEHGESFPSNSRFGRYHTFYPDGWYGFTFEAEDFETHVSDDVYVNITFPAHLDVAMISPLSAVGNNLNAGDGLSVFANSLTGILQYEIANPSQVDIQLYDLRGALVNSLVREFQPAGQYQINWPRQNDQGQTMASGMYFYRITAGDAFRSGKVVLVN